MVCRVFRGGLADAAGYGNDCRVMLFYDGFRFPGKRGRDYFFEECFHQENLDRFWTDIGSNETCQLPVRRNVVIVYQKFRDIENGIGQGGGGIERALWIDLIHEDNEARI